MRRCCSNLMEHVPMLQHHSKKNFKLQLNVFWFQKKDKYKLSKFNKRWYGLHKYNIFSYTILYYWSFWVSLNPTLC
jgi:hypothetical protein